MRRERTNSSANKQSCLMVYKHSIVLWGSISNIYWSTWIDKSPWYLIRFDSSGCVKYFKHLLCFGPEIVSKVLLTLSHFEFIIVFINVQSLFFVTFDWLILWSAPNLRRISIMRIISQDSKIQSLYLLPWFSSKDTRLY